MTNVALSDVLSQISWWQRWEIEPGVFTSGPHDVKKLIDELQWPASFEGKRVLDIGGWNGAFSFECERRGASEVVMIEPTPSSSTGFEMTKAYLQSKVVLAKSTIYNLDPRFLGYFDVVLCLGVIYHLRYPLLGLDNIRRVCKGDLYVESAVLESGAWTKEGVQPLDAIGPNLSDYPFLQFFDKKQYFNDGTNWFVPNRFAADAMIEAAGFDIVISHAYKNTRYFAKAHVKEGDPPIFTLSHEGMDYDIHASHLLGPRSNWAVPG